MEDDQIKNFVFLVTNLDTFSKVSSTTSSGVKSSITQSYRFLISNLMKEKKMVLIVQTALSQILGEVLSKDEFKDFILSSFPPNYSWKMFCKELKELNEFLIDNIQITDKDAALMINLYITQVKFFGEYLQIETKFNTDIIEHGYE